MPLIILFVRSFCKLLYVYFSLNCRGKDYKFGMMNFEWRKPYNSFGRTLTDDLMIRFYTSGEVFDKMKLIIEEHNLRLYHGACVNMSENLFRWLSPGIFK